MRNIIDEREQEAINDIESKLKREEDMHAKKMQSNKEWADAIEVYAKAIASAVSGKEEDISMLSSKKERERQAGECLRAIGKVEGKSSGMEEVKRENEHAQVIKLIKRLLQSNVNLNVASKETTISQTNNRA